MGCQQKSLKQRAIPRFESTENWRQIIAVYKLPLNYFNYFKRLQKTRPPSPHPNKFLAVPGKFWGIVGQDPNEPIPTGYMLASSGFALFKIVCLRYIV